MSSNSRLCGTFNKDGKYMKNVLAISEGESQLLKVKRKTSLSPSLHGSRGESRTQKTAKEYKLFKKSNLLSKI